MKTLYAKKKVAIAGNPSSRSVEPLVRNGDRNKGSFIELEIAGDQDNGYNLVMTPEGCFTADYWFETLAEAKKTAEELYGVSEKEWK